MRIAFTSKATCQVQVADRHDAVVLADHLIKWDIPGMGDHGPDIAVVFGARPGQRKSFKVAKEGARPALIIEVTSPATRHTDLTRKPQEYWQCLVPCLVIVDELPRRRHRRLRIMGFQHGPRGLSAHGLG